VQLQPNAGYIASYYAPNGRYAYEPAYFATGLDVAPLHAPAGSSGGNGLFNAGSHGFPTGSFNNTNYWVTPVVTTTAPPPDCPCTLFGQQVPANPSSSDTDALELGVRFTTDVPGQITGVRFYKGTGNTGTHTGTLWTATGSVLATGTFTNESATGWQTLTFASPVDIVPGTTYTASYHTNTGHQAFNNAFFDSEYASNPLRGVAGSNGVYLVGASGFPTNSYNNTNYWVDVVFQTTG
jgi:hypothetical protein